MKFNAYIFLLVVLCSITSCSNKTFDYKTFLNNPLKRSGNSPVKTVYKPKSTVIKAIFKIPSVNRIAEELAIARSQIKLIDTQKNTQIVGTGAFGVRDEYNTESTGVGYGTLRAERVLTDNQRLENSQKLAQLDEEGKKIDLVLDFNRKLQQVLNAYNTKQTALETQKILRKYLSIYEGKASLIERAVSIGAISNSDFLEIKGIRNEAMSKLSKARLLERQSESKIKQNLGKFYLGAVEEIDKRNYSLEQSTSSKKTNLNLRKFRMQEEKIEIEIAIKEQSLKPISKLSASITSPQEKDKDKTLFAGVTVEFPIKDGGKSAIEIEILEQQKAVLKSEFQETENKIEIIEENWNSFKVFYNDEKKLIEDRITISKKRLKELDILQRQGRVNAGIYVKEVLKLANTEVDLINLDAEFFSNLLSRMEAASSVCIVLNMCNDLNRYVESF